TKYEGRSKKSLNTVLQNRYVISIGGAKYRLRNLNEVRGKKGKEVRKEVKEISEYRSKKPLCHFDMRYEVPIEKSRMHASVIENSYFEISHAHFVRFEMTAIRYTSLF
ncbi:hypothetical protein, partial [uncultured Eudoraea sp.]|uniref:hypothetical protein n=1 Tax=uncultured Eudoraea sp. TaxID=1035614 RepID=UPI002624A328